MLRSAAEHSVPFISVRKTENEKSVYSRQTLPVMLSCMIDFDGAGEKQIAAITLFHGDKIRSYKKVDGANEYSGQK